MAEMIAVRAEPGGRVVLTFCPEGYAADRETIGVRVERWNEKYFNTLRMVIVLGVTILLSLPGWILRANDASATLYWTVLAPAGLCLLYIVIGFLAHLVHGATPWVLTIVTLPFLVIRRYRHWLFAVQPPVWQRRGFVPAAGIRQGWVTADGAETVVTVLLADGRQVRYVSEGGALPGTFAKLIGPRLSGQVTPAR
ncbi:hypothetical protein OIE66_01295 [Nonomuraea sp. NBC_01738]|uniref:hypothetical protein n=1 Tax=Nonomuraea sp. NBC_01738 TaxID=2976003 RepID=UPI002E1626E2|nr:hypothetical protein OIE66_01295 [Nonomuraea sp. NBC_01738]